MKKRWKIITAICTACLLLTAGCGAASESSDADSGQPAESAAPSESAAPEENAADSSDAQPDNESEAFVTEESVSAEAHFSGDEAALSQTEDAAGSVPASEENTSEEKETSSSAECTVTSTATAVITAEPDMAEIYLGVMTTEEDAASAQDSNTKTVNSVLNTLEEIGVDEKSIMTSSYDIYPNYDYSSGEDELTGYTVTTMLTISDQKIKDAGDIIDQCVDAGANIVDGVTYTCSNYDDLYDQALEKAVQAGKEKSSVLAKAADKDLGEVVSIDEEYQDTSGKYQSLTLSEETAGSADSASQLLPGQLEITAAVTVTYQLQ